MEPRCLFPKEAAAYCGVPLTTLRKHGPGPICIGRRKVYDIVLLNEWLDQLSGRAKPSAIKDEEERLLELIRNG